MKLESIFKNPVTYNNKYSITRQKTLTIKKTKNNLSDQCITNIQLIDRNIQNTNNGDDGSEDFENDGDVDNEAGDDKDNGGNTNDDGGDDQKFGDDVGTNDAGNDNDDGNDKKQNDNGDTNNDAGDIDNIYGGFGGSGDSEGRGSSNDDVNKDVEGGDVNNKNDGGVDDDGVNIMGVMISTPLRHIREV